MTDDPTNQMDTNTFIKEIRLQNWRQYEGEQTIPLAPEDDARINAIIGENGTGKTNLAKAVSTCLNGEVPGESEVEDVEPHVNSEVMEALDPGEQAHGSLTLRLTHQGTDYRITREFTSTQRDTGCTNTIADDLNVHRHTDAGGWEPVENPNTHLARILPPEVQQYYFFDGERLDQLFEPGYESDVRDAIQELSHIEVLDRGIDHLGTLRDVRRRKAKSASGEVAEARDALAEKEAARKDILHEKADVERRLQAKQSALAEVEDDMGAAADPDVLGLMSQREKLEAQIESLHETEDDLENELTHQLVEAGTINLAMGALKEAIDHFERLGAKDQLPPDVRRVFLNSLLDDGECICSCDLDTHPTHRQHVVELRDETPAISDRTIEASYEFPDTRATGLDRYQELVDTKTDLREATLERLSKEQEREELSERLRAKDVPDDVDLDALDQQREQLRSEINTLQTQRGRLAERLESVDAEIEAAKQRVEAELKKDARHDELIQEVKQYKRARSRLQTIKDTLMTEVRDAIETSLDAYYNELTWKDETYDLSLDATFSIQIEGPEGLRQVEKLSAGETELLALSFIAALTEVSGFDAPVLIDTPVGRIDEKHRSAIGEKLPGFLAGHQLTFLFTDAEYDDVVAAELEARLANKYRLDNDNRVTRVTPAAQPPMETTDE